MLPWRGLPCTLRGHLLLPWGWQHLHHWAHSAGFWDAAGETDQTTASPQERIWRPSPMERPEPWHRPGGVRDQVPHHRLWRFYKGTTLTCINALTETKIYTLFYIEYNLYCGPFFSHWSYIGIHGEWGNCSEWSWAYTCGCLQQTTHKPSAFLHNTLWNQHHPTISHYGL